MARIWPVDSTKQCAHELNSIHGTVRYEGVTILVSTVTVSAARRTAVAVAPSFHGIVRNMEDRGITTVFLP